MGDNFNLSENAVKIFNDLYSFQDENISQTFERVASEFATNDTEKEIAYDLLADGYWRPNTPVFLNAGTDHKVFSACYVVGLEDSMDSIYDVANVCRKIFQYGAGVGIPIGNLREKEAWIYEGKPEILPEGKSSGPITFMKLFDAVGETTKSGGRVRRAAILVSMPVWHPDIMDFVNCKEVDGRLANMNISVSITDKFMQSLKDGIPFDLVSPADGKKVGEIDPQVLWGKLSEMAWKIADPGVIFIDRMNEYNVLSKKILVEATNPCGEQPLQPFNACNLSAINISKFVKEDGSFDWDGLYDTTFNIMLLMNNLIDVMHFPDDDDGNRFRTNTLKYRPVGIGPMGIADAMFMLGYKYDGADGRKFASEVMKTMTRACVHRSALIAKEQGPFSMYDDFKEDVERIIGEHIDNDEEIMKLVREHGVRNCQFTTCQPTGTTALSCDASYGIEPSFGLVFQKNLISGEKMIVANSSFRKKCEEEKIYSSDLLERIFKNGGSLKGLHNIPKEIKRVFVTAHDIKYKDRIDMQAELQKHCSTAISSTVNLSKETEINEISDLYKYAYEKGLKGITIYRDGSKKNQPVTFKDEEVKTPSLSFERPNVLDSKTHLIETGNGKMYVTVCHYEGKPVEIFFNLGKSGQILNTLSEALGRVISIGLQKGVPAEEITKTLININSDKMVWWRFEPTDKKPTQILSIPDGVAKLIDRYYSGTQYAGELSGELCDKCGNVMTAMEGCFNCPACGHSKCS